MLRSVLLSKIYRATLTNTNLNYIGSIGIDATLLNAAGILPYEQVQVVNLSNGERLITYAIAARANSRAVELNGAAARLGLPGDQVIIMTYGQLTAEQLNQYTPTIVLVDEQNCLLEVSRCSRVSDVLLPH